MQRPKPLHFVILSAGRIVTADDLLLCVTSELNELDTESADTDDEISVAFGMLARVEQILDVCGGDLRHLSAVKQECAHSSGNAVAERRIGKQLGGKNDVERGSADALMKRELCDRIEHCRNAVGVGARTGAHSIAEGLAGKATIGHRTHTASEVDSSLKKRAGSGINVAADRLVFADHSPEGIEHAYRHRVGLVVVVTELGSHIQKHLTFLFIAHKFRSALLLEFGRQDARAGWTQQYHYGPIRNNNSKMMRLLGPDTGYDSIGTVDTAASMARFLDKLCAEDNLAQTILYCINPSDNEMLATMIGNFQEGPVPGKIQFGSGWWFNDQKDGMERQMNALSLLGLLSRFVGMLTDSRSFLSYPRHEYFRRTLCNMLGNDVENGELPVEEMSRISRMVQDICYYNAKNYFRF